MITGTLSRYFGLRFLNSVVGSFIGVVALAAMIDYVELMRRGADWPNATAWLLAKISLFRVPQLTERIMPFTVLVGAMSCYLTLSRRLELVVARAAGVSAWQFVAPAMIAAFVFGAVATTLYNPVAAVLHERSKRLEAEMLGELPSTAVHENTSGFWVRQRSAEGAAIINAKSSRQQGSQLGNVSVYTFDNAGHFHQRIEAKTAILEEGYWRLEDARIYVSGSPPTVEETYRLATTLTLEQVRESFATPETVPFWQLPSYIELADRAGSCGGRLPSAISAAVGAPLPSCRHGHARGLGQPALLPFRRRAEDGPERHFGGVPAVRVVEDHGGHEQVGTSLAGHGGVDSGAGRRSDWICCVVVPGGRVVAYRAGRFRRSFRGPVRAAATLCVALLLCMASCVLTAERSLAQDAVRNLLTFPKRPVQPKPPTPASDGPMLVQASEIRYDYTNNTVSAVGSVQAYYRGATIEADELIYDQKSKRLRAQGNVRLTEPDGKITYGQLIDLSDDYRDGFVDSLRLETVDDTRFAAARADRTSGNYTVLQNGVYTACLPCQDDPKKPPLWEVRAARIIHDQGEKMLYFEDARIEFFGMPLAYVPFMSAPDPTVKRKSGFLFPTLSTTTQYGFGLRIPYFWALAPNYDLTVSTNITTRQGPAVRGRLAPAPDRGLVLDQGRRHLPGRPGLLCHPRRREQPDRGHVPRRHPDGGPVRD